MKKILLFLFLSITVFAQAQKYTLEGKVTQQNNKALPGAVLKVLKNNQGTITNFDGFYQLKLNNGIYNIEISYVGYQTVVKT